MRANFNWSGGVRGSVTTTSSMRHRDEVNGHRGVCPFRWVCPAPMNATIAPPRCRRMGSLSRIFPMRRRRFHQRSRSNEPEGGTQSGLGPSRPKPFPRRGHTCRQVARGWPPLHPVSTIEGIFNATPSPAGARAVRATRPTTELPLREKVGNPQAIIGDESIQRSNRRMLHHCVDELSRVGHPHRLERQ